MQRYFTNNIDSNEAVAILLDDSFHHVKNVMRNKINDEIIVCDFGGNCFQSVIKEIQSQKIITNLTKKIENNELPVSVDLAQGLIRRERFEYVLQKSTELGVKNILPVHSKYSIIKLESKKETQKIKRWNKIAQEASEQSHRSACAKVSPVKNSFKAIDYSKYDQVIVAYERENHSQKLQKAFQQKVSRILIVVGPEGGLHNDEITFFETLKNVIFVGLGKRILRSETASSYLLSVIGFHYEIGDLS